MTKLSIDKKQNNKKKNQWTYVVSSDYIKNIQESIGIKSSKIIRTVIEAEIIFILTQCEDDPELQLFILKHWFNRKSFGFQTKAINDSRKSKGKKSSNRSYSLVPGNETEERLLIKAKDLGAFQVASSVFKTIPSYSFSPELRRLLRTSEKILSFQEMYELDLSDIRIQKKSIIIDQDGVVTYG